MVFHDLLVRFVFRLDIIEEKIKEAKISSYFETAKELKPLFEANVERL